jgi:chromosome segregation ATPase
MSKELTNEELLQANAELEKKVKVNDKQLTDATAKISELSAKIADAEKREAALNKALTESASELGIAETVVETLKSKIANLEALADSTEASKTLHKHGKKKYRLLYAVSFRGQDVTDEALSGNEKLLGELIEAGSGAVQEVQ